jgi:DeoR family transcriptional regulator, fructose operon transcriptional repressor
MLLEKRRELITGYLKNNEYARIDELAKELAVSESTIRRDLELLEKECLLERIHGGAKKPNGLENNMSFTFFREQINTCKEEKRKIAEFAASLVKNGETVIIDAGSSAYYVAEQLRNKSIQVITNSLPAINLLADSSVELVVPGGSLFSKAGVLLSSLTEEILGKLNANKFFMGVGGIFQNQITNVNMLLVDVQKIMMGISKETIIVADHTKFNKKSLYQVADISSVQQIITDSATPKEYKAICTQNNVIFTACK